MLAVVGEGGMNPLLSYHYNSQYSPVFKRGSFQHSATGLVHWQLLKGACGSNTLCQQKAYTTPSITLSPNQVFSHTTITGVQDPLQIYTFYFPHAPNSAYD